MAGVVLAVICLVPATAQAQTQFGIKGGLLYSTFDFNDIDDVIDGSAGWTAGLFFDGNRDSVIGWMVELNYLSRKGDLDGDSVRLGYFQVPVFARLNFGSDTVAGYFVAGPNFDFKVSEDSDITVLDEYEGFDVGLTAGLGVELGAFLIEGRGTWGFRNIAKDFEASDLKTRSFALLVGLRFN